MRIALFSFLGTCLVLFLVSCQGDEPDKQSKEISVYTGPMMTAYDIRTLYSDSGYVELVIEAPVQNQYADGNREFPEGIAITQFNSEGDSVSRLTANYAKYVKETEIYTAIGHVVVKNLEEDKTLQSEVLHWDKERQLVYTDKHVQITTEKEILTGKGLEAKDDFSEYEILEPEGIFSVEGESI